MSNSKYSKKELDVIFKRIDVITDRIRENGIGQQRVASAAKVSLGALSRTLKGHSIPQEWTLMRLEKYLGITE